MGAESEPFAGGAIHPGEVLLEQFLRTTGATQRELAEAIGVPLQRVQQLVAGEQAVCADLALRLGRYFGTAPELWLQLQNQYDLDCAAEGLDEVVQAIQPRVTREGARG